jgi:mRNA interferase YafQ
LARSLSAILKPLKNAAISDRSNAKVLEILETEGKLPEKYLSHKLSGSYINYWECHLQPDWLLIWEQNEAQKEIKMIRTGTHSDLFK